MQIMGNSFAIRMEVSNSNGTWCCYPPYSALRKASRTLLTYHHKKTPSTSSNTHRLPILQYYNQPLRLNSITISHPYSTAQPQKLSQTSSILPTTTEPSLYTTQSRSYLSRGSDTPSPFPSPPILTYLNINRP